MTRVNHSMCVPFRAEQAKGRMSLGQISLGRIRKGAKESDTVCWCLPASQARYGVYVKTAIHK